jgi:hypothetical protein
MEVERVAFARLERLERREVGGVVNAVERLRLGFDCERVGGLGHVLVVMAA